MQGINSASLCSLAGRYVNPIPTRFLAVIDCLKILALVLSVELAQQLHQHSGGNLSGFRPLKHTHFYIRKYHKLSTGLCPIVFLFSLNRYMHAPHVANSKNILNLEAKNDLVTVYWLLYVNSNRAVTYLFILHKAGFGGLVDETNSRLGFKRLAEQR